MTEKTEQRWTYFYDLPHLMGEVANITATLASRPVMATKNGGPDMAGRPWLVMTEDHEALFARLAKDAMALVRTRLRRYVEPEHCGRDMKRQGRLHLHTLMRVEAAEDGIPATVRVLDDLIRMFIIWWVIWQWLLLKAPDEAGAAQARAEQTLADIVSAAKTANGTARRPYRLY